MIGIIGAMDEEVAALKEKMEVEEGNRPGFYAICGR